MRRTISVFTLLLVAFGSFALSGVSFVSLSLAPVAHADAPPCFDITGSGKAVLVNGVANSGVVHFDAPYEPDHQYAACARDMGGGAMRLEGWVWNDNLGWISLFCQGGLNLGANCGNNVNYGVTIDNAGKFSGFAWGDNVGWISFDNGNFSQVRMEMNDAQCKGALYGFTPPQNGCAAHGNNLDDGKKWTSAWSDNVGWIDFDGVKIPSGDLQKTVSDVTVSFLDKNGALIDPSLIKKFRAGQANVPANAQLPPVADGNDHYTLRVTVLDQDGAALDPARYQVNLTPVWAKDTVKKNQTSNVDFNNANCLENMNAQKAVTKPCASGDFAADAQGHFDAVIKSIAPTSNMNGQSDANGNVNFSYETILGPSTLSSVQSNDLELQGVNVNIVDTQANPPTSIYPDASGTPKLVSPVYQEFDHSLKFLPATEVTQLNAPAPKVDVIDMLPADVGIAKDFAVNMVGSGQIEFRSAIDPLDPELNFVLDDHDPRRNNDPSPTITLDDDASWQNYDKSASHLWAGLSQQNPNNPLPPTVSGLYLWSVVHDVATGATYYSNKLPRVTADSGVTPVAVFRGNVYSPGLLGGNTNQAVKSVGDSSTNAARDAIYKNVKKLIAGIAPAAQPQAGKVMLVSDLATGGFKTSPGSVGTEASLMPLVVGDQNKGSRVYYAKGDVYLSGSPMTWTNERTIITIGGSVYINGDLYNPSPSAPRPKLGIIAFADPVHPKANEGNVYIASTVKNLQGVNIVARTVFSYDSVKGIDMQTGLPKFDAIGPGSADEVLKKNQLFCECTILSRNTIGGASHAGNANDLYVLGDGTKSNDKEKAKLYDLNYLRRFTGRLKLNPQTGKPLNLAGNQDLDPQMCITKSSDGTPWSVHDSSAGGCLFPPSELGGGPYNQPIGLSKTTDLGAFYVYFDPPTSTQPGFTSDANQSRKQGGN